MKSCDVWEVRDVLANASAAAVLREYDDAIDAGNTELALRILHAHPDVWEFREWRADLGHTSTK